MSIKPPSKQAVEAVTRPVRAKITEDLAKNQIVVDQFKYQGGERILTAIYNDGRLMLRGMTSEHASCNINLDATGANRLAITLAKYLDIHKLNKKDQK